MVDITVQAKPGTDPALVERMNWIGRFSSEIGELVANAKGRTLRPDRYHQLVAEALQNGLTKADIHDTLDKMGVIYPKLKPGTSLADDIMNPKGQINDGAWGALDMTAVRRGIQQAHRIVLDDAATEMMVQLSQEQPKGILQMLRAARPLHKIMWIEFPSKVMLQARFDRVIEQCRLHGVDPKDVGFDQATIDSREDWHRTGMLVDVDGDTLITNCIEHTQGHSYMQWPLGFRIALEGQPFRGTKEGQLIPHQHGASLVTKKGRFDEERSARALWGYGDQIDVKPLIGRCMGSSHPDLIRYMTAEMQREALSELSGWTRMTVSCLAMLNSVAVVEAAVKPKGMRLVAGKPKPFLSMAPAFLTIPRRIRKVDDYVRREIKKTGIRHRLHEVQPHYRHLSHQPKTEGWQEVVIQGETFWRKRIDGHLRGDPELGVVEHDYTVAKGKRP